MRAAHVPRCTRPRALSCSLSLTAVSAPVVPPPGTFRIHRLDSLFLEGGPWASERLAFGHFDVEGSELDLLQGAAAVLRRDRPVFTVEQALGDVEGSLSLLRYIESLGFQAHMVPEVCGRNRDCRNFICVPLERPLTDRVLTANTVPVEASALNTSALMRVPTVSPRTMVSE